MADGLRAAACRRVAWRRFVTAGVLGGLGVLLGAAAMPAAAAVPMTCPSRLIRIVRSAGGTNDYLGTVAGIADLCRMTRADGTADYYLGIWRTDWPGAGQAYPVMRQVLFGGAGARASFVTRSVPGFQFTDTFINGGPDTVMVAGIAHPALKFAHEREGIEGNTYHSIITSWRDEATGAVLRTEELQISGQSYGPATTWHAVGIEPLP